MEPLFHDVGHDPADAPANGTSVIAAKATAAANEMMDARMDMLFIGLLATGERDDFIAGSEDTLAPGRGDEAPLSPEGTS